MTEPTRGRERAATPRRRARTAHGPRADHETRAELTTRLMAEYGDAVPPGQVLAAVARATRAVEILQADPTAWLALCESGARRRIESTRAIGRVSR